MTDIGNRHRQGNIAVNETNGSVLSLTTMENTRWLVESCPSLSSESTICRHSVLCRLQKGDL